MRIASRLLPPSAYPFTTPLDVRLTDLDFARHVNNAAVAALHEEVRVRFHMAYMGSENVFDRQAGGGVVAHVAIQYIREISYGIPLVGCAGIARLGNSSYTMAQALFQSGGCVSEVTCVIAQRVNGLADPLSSELRLQLNTLMVSGAA